MLFSRIVASRGPNFERMRKNVIETTATGIDALTVRPTLRTRYSDDAPKIMPRSVPMITGSTVSSRICVAAGMYGSNSAGPSGARPMMSGNSCSLTLMHSPGCRELPHSLHANRVRHCRRKLRVNVTSKVLFGSREDRAVVFRERASSLHSISISRDLPRRSRTR